MGVATASSRKWHFRIQLLAVSFSGHPFGFQLLAIHRPKQSARYAASSFGTVVRIPAGHSSGGAVS